MSDLAEFKKALYMHAAKIYAQRKEKANGDGLWDAFVLVTLDNPEMVTEDLEELATVEEVIDQASDDVFEYSNEHYGGYNE